MTSQFPAEEVGGQAAASVRSYPPIEGAVHTLHKDVKTAYADRADCRSRIGSNLAAEKRLDGRRVTITERLIPEGAVAATHGDSNRIGHIRRGSW